MANGPQIGWRADGDHIIVEAYRPKLLAREALSLSQWPSALAPTGSAVARIQAALEDATFASDGQLLASATDNGVRLHPAFVAALESQEAQSLGLPLPTRLAIDLRSQGIAPEPGFRIASQWVRPGGAPARAAVQGAMVTHDGAVRRIPEPLYSLWRSAQRLAEPLDEQPRYAALADLRAALPEGARSAVSANGYLEDLRIHYAAGFSLKLGRGGPFDFDPVLFGRHAVDEAGDGAALHEDDDSILAPNVQRLFAENRFRAARDARGVYVLEGGEYVFVDPALRPALQVVRRMQDASEADRRRFISDPRRAIVEATRKEDGTSVDVESLFVETEQFSARIAGVDVWRTQVLPWLKQQPNTWLPERFGLRVGDEYIEVAPDQVEPLVEAVDKAIESGAPVATAGGLSIPATQQAREALESLLPFAEEDLAPSVREETVRFEGAGKLFLLVRENFEHVEYAPLDADRPSSPPALVAPDRVKTSLKPHQLDGLSWLAHAATAGLRGVLLADDMGLGKTLQAIAFMAWLQDEAAAGRRAASPFLVVAPTGLLANWREEIERHLDERGLGQLVLAFGPNLKALREDGAFSDRDIASGRASLDTDAWQHAGVVLTTYETMRDYHFSFARRRFGVVVFDEAQKLKNPTSQVTRASKTLSADFVLGMTGTPVENRLQDLWSLMDVVSPGVLGASRDFDQRFPSGNPEAMARLRALLADGQGNRPPRLLRRLKSDHLPGLPTKHMHARSITMPDRQARAYEQVVRRAVAGRGALSRWDGMLQILHAMRGVSLHPIDPAEAPDDLEAYAADSARLKWTLEILGDVAERREKALIFLESLAMQDRLAGLIQQRFKLAALPMRIHGGVPGTRRQDLVRRFQVDTGRFDVMILSPKAGGVGLTLTAANHVIHLSRWWNPAVEDQSTDRVYRIGQEKAVHVYLPMAVHPDPVIGPASFDLRLDALIERKRALSGHMFAPPEGSEDDIAALFSEVSGGPMSSEVAEALPLAEETLAALAEPPEPTSEAAPTKQPILQESVPAQPSPPPQPPQASRPSAETLQQRFAPRRWRCGQNQSRPLDEILGPIKGAHIRELKVVDPYAIADLGARRAQAEFIKQVVERARAIDAITIEYAETRDLAESDTQQRTDINRRLLAVTSGTSPRIALVRRPRGRAGGGDFHDRFVFVECTGRSNSDRQVHEYDLGRGVLGLMNERFECTVHYMPPT